MIFIHRGRERTSCPDLSSIRERELTRVRAEIANGEPVSEKLLGPSYRVARDPLRQAQRRKCCYCEVKPNSQRWHTVEHVRPKSYYWWLTWTWDNLLFACHDCNNAKLDQFPLTDEATRLLAEARPPGEEDPLIIDPSVRDPRKHICFWPVRHDLWFPIARKRDPLGQRTLEALQWTDPESMQQDGLVEAWQDHVASLRPRILALRSSFSTKNAGQIQRDWNEHTRRRRRAGQPFVALTLDVLEFHFDHEIERWQLPLTVIYD